jgi:hypothetical protein
MILSQQRAGAKAPNAVTQAAGSTSTCSHLTLVTASNAVCWLLSFPSAPRLPSHTTLPYCTRTPGLCSCQPSQPPRGATNPNESWTPVRASTVTCGAPHAEEV